jgi:transposase
MEAVLGLYTQPYDPHVPLVCMDETSKQLVGETRRALAPRSGVPRRYDYEYERHGTANVFMVCEPLRGRRWVTVTERRTKVDWAHLIQDLVDHRYPRATRIQVVMDNLNTHTPASLYEAFEPAEARRLLDRLEFHYTPKHGSWLNMAEIEFSILGRQCLHRRIPTVAQLGREVAAWEQTRNASTVPVDWRFTTADARIKLKRLYPSTQN